MNVPQLTIDTLTELNKSLALLQSHMPIVDEYHYRSAELAVVQAIEAIAATFIHVDTP